MKPIKFILCIVASLLLVSCIEQESYYPTYDYAIGDIIADSLKAKKMQFIKETVEAASANLKTDDYEDPEDVAHECSKIFDDTYSINVEGLKIKVSENEFPRFIPYSQLDTKQQEIFKLLKAGKRYKR